MRLTLGERHTITSILRRYFGAQAEVLLFGSRVDDSQKGGDIDLLVDTTQNDDVFRKKLLALSELQLALGDQKIDLIVNVSSKGMVIPGIVEEAMATGVEL